ncbi:MAG TPA: YifB family Mg chelatase-like AAA ATPase [Solirubrobacteraceae bacterium]|jgi:magnesium chelatase family protein|nr:YifB family Mg chelatase-like AAA ATPase [Solirubrobacteraceae bacterium]
MLARTRTFTIEGLQTRPVTVEVDIRSGLPGFAIVGLADASVREARERVQAAILNSGYEFPARRITVNLAPGDVPKVGPGLDLALACGVLAASEQLPKERLDTHALFGELALDGGVRGCQGTLAVAQACAEERVGTLVLAPERAREAALVDGLVVAAAERLKSAARVLSGGPPDPLPDPDDPEPDGGGASAHGPDLSEVRGQHHAVRALIVAAAGGHNCLLSGSPGTGKTMLAQRAPSILPELSRPEAIEVTRIHSIAGETEGVLAQSRPFRAPHHSITTAGLVGGARKGWVGEVVLAHRGVLFLDELSEFAKPALEALRQPLEDGRVAIVRARHSAVYPARFMLLAATNPCPCGYAGEGERCQCSETDMARHRRKLSGPLLDRIDLQAKLENAGSEGLGAEPWTNSAKARERVTEARERQARRLREECTTVNAHMDVRMLERHARLDEQGQRMLRDAQSQGTLSARGQHRTLRVARTIADLNGCERVRVRDIGVALSLRPETGLRGSRAA